MVTVMTCTRTQAMSGQGLALKVLRVNRYHVVRHGRFSRQGVVSQPLNKEGVARRGEMDGVGECGGGEREEGFARSD